MLRAKLITLTKAHVSSVINYSDDPKRIREGMSSQHVPLDSKKEQLLQNS